METGGDETADVGDIGEDQRPDLIGDDPELLIIDDPGVGAGADDDDLRAVFLREGFDLVEIDGFRLPVHAVEDAAVELSRETGRTSVRKMTPMGEVHPEDCVAWLKHCEIDCHIGLNACVGLNIGVFRPEKLLAPGNGQPLHDVDELASSIISPARIALCVLVRHDASLGLKNGLADEVFRGDHFQLSGLSPGFLENCLRDLRVGLHQIRHGFFLLFYFKSISRILSRRL